MPNATEEPETLRERNHRYYLSRARKRRKKGLLMRLDAPPCYYCGRRANERIARVNPETGEEFMANWCGNC